MTLESFASRLATGLALSGLGVWVAAVVCWASVGDAGPPAHSIHTVAGWCLAVFGTVLLGIGLTISSAVPPRARPEDPGAEVSERVS
jgi:hypothetical protein